MPNVSQMLSVAALATGLGVDAPLDSVRRAQALLASHTWSEIVRIENTSACSRYPRVLPALVFQMNSVLWFYTPTDGTQSLSLYRNRAEADKSDLGPLLKAIDPGFTHWQVLPEAVGEPPSGGRPPNGCFIESLAILFERLARGERIENPKLLSYYVQLPGGIRGHTVLQFSAGGRIMIVDPDCPLRATRIRYANEGDPKSVADRIRGDVARARHLPLGEFLDRGPGRYYATLSPQSHGVREPAATQEPFPMGNRRS
jgi:hypothetical protein